MSLTDEANQLTNGWIQWNFFGKFINTKYQYTPRQLGERAFIISTFASCAYLASYKTNNLAVVALSGITGFLISHTITMSPALYKRYQYYQTCLTIQNRIENSESFKDNQEPITRISEIIFKHVDKKATAIWGKRARLMNNFENILNDRDANQCLLSYEKPKEIIEFLNDYGAYDYQRKSTAMNSLN